MSVRSVWPVLIGLPLLVGCGGAKDQAPKPSGPVTFSRDVAPILFARCANCHRPGEAAPFSLLTYEDARKRAQQIRDVTQTRFMPPWLPESGHAKFQDERRLAEHEIEVLSRWATAGAPAGDASELPPPPSFTSGWQLGEPDLILESPAFQLPAAGPDRFRNFVLTAPAQQPRWIRAVELRPENPRVIHHARLGIDTSGESERRDAADAQPGYEGMAWGQDPKGQLITWTPGMLPDWGITGAAWKLSPAAKLVLHMHLQPSGKEEQVRFRVGLYFTESPPTVQPLVVRIGTRDIDIPAGQATHAVDDVYTLPIDVVLHSIFPHGHKLCQEIVVEAVLPAGAPQTLIAIRQFDEKWHDKYRLATPLRLPQGTQLRTKFRYDNSAANVRNPNHPPRRVVYGSNADDEMSDVFLQVTPVDPAQYAVLAEHQKAAEVRSKIIGYRKTLALHLDDPWSIEGLASSYVANREPAKAIELLDSRRRVLEKSPPAMNILAAALLAAGDAQAAERLLRRSLAGDDRDPIVWLGLGQALAAQKQTQPAEEAFGRALAASPDLMVARLDLIDLLVSQGRLDEAAAAARTAADLFPEEYQPLMKLADVYARQRKHDASLTAFSQARKIAPFVFAPRSSLAIACYQLGDEQTAVRLLQEAIAIDDRDPVPRCFLGQIARRNSAWSDARRNLQLALELPIPRTWPASHVGQFLKLVYTERLLLAEQLQDAELARTTLQAWAKLEPDNAGVRKMLAEIDAAKSGASPSPAR